MNRLTHLMLAALVPLFAAPTQALACMTANIPFGNGGPFQPDVEKFRKELVEYRSSVGGPVPRLPVPSMEILSVVRGSPTSNTCGRGLVKVQVTWPKSAPYPFNEVGFYFRVVEGSIPKDFDLSPYTFPIAIGQAENNSFEATFYWSEDPPSQQKPLNFTLEIFAVNKGLEIGPSTRIQVR